mmetsp:Transcript_15967/g.50048  ORF Transcript_15967/g.50048 Transcript_15967/m.50048 type:complete len:464 (-) Transcript_15967:566-1957(-)
MSAIDITLSQTNHQCVVGDAGLVSLTTSFGSCRRRPEPASFLKNLRCILLTEDPRIISWSDNGRITISDPVSLSNEILHRYFRHSQFSSFQRQLNYFGYYKVSGKGKMHRCVYTNDALPSETDGTPGVNAPPYPVDVLLRLKRKSSQDKPGGPSAMPPNEAVKRLSEAKATKPARRRSFGGVKEGMRATAALQRHQSEPRISQDLSSTDEVFDWAEPIDSHTDLDDAGDDVSPHDYAALLSDETDVPEPHQHYFSPIPPPDHRDLGVPAQAAPCDSRAWRSTFPAYSDHAHPALVGQLHLASSGAAWEAATVPKRRDIDQRSVSPWPTKAMRGVPRVPIAHPSARLGEANQQQTTLQKHAFDNNNARVQDRLTNYQPYHVGLNYDAAGTREPFQLQLDFKVKQDPQQYLHAHGLRPRPAELNFGEQGFARRLSMSSEPQTPTHETQSMNLQFAAVQGTPGPVN